MIGIHSFRKVAILLLLLLCNNVNAQSGLLPDGNTVGKLLRDQDGLLYFNAFPEEPSEIPIGTNDLNAEFQHGGFFFFSEGASKDVKIGRFLASLSPVSQAHAQEISISYGVVGNRLAGEQYQIVLANEHVSTSSEFVVDKTLVDLGTGEWTVKWEDVLGADAANSEGGVFDLSIAWQTADGAIIDYKNLIVSLDAKQPTIEPISPTPYLVDTPGAVFLEEAQNTFTFQIDDSGVNSSGIDNVTVFGQSNSDSSIYCTLGFPRDCSLSINTSTNVLTVRLNRTIGFGGYVEMDVRVQDGVGNLVSNQYEYRVVSDNLAPEIQSLTVNEGIPLVDQSVVSEEVTRISVDYSDSIAVNNLSLYIDAIQGGSIDQAIFINDDCSQVCPKTGTKIFQLDQPLGVGVYSYNLQITDSAGNPSTEQGEFYINLSGEVASGDVSLANRSAPLELVVDRTFEWDESDRTLRGTRFPNTAVHLNGVEIIPIGSDDWEYVIPDELVQIEGVWQLPEETQFVKEGRNTLAISWVDNNDNESDLIEFVVTVNFLRLRAIPFSPVITSPVSEFEIQLNLGGDIDLESSYVDAWLTDSSGSYGFYSAVKFERLPLEPVDQELGLYNVVFPELLADGVWVVSTIIVESAESTGGSTYTQRDINSLTLATLGVLPSVYSSLPAVSTFTGTTYLTSSTREILFRVPLGTTLKFNDEEITPNREGSVSGGRRQLYYLPTQLANDVDVTELEVKQTTEDGLSSEILNYKLIIDETDPSVALVFPTSDQTYQGDVSSIQLSLDDKHGQIFSDLTNDASNPYVTVERSGGFNDYLICRKRDFYGQDCWSYDSVTKTLTINLLESDGGLTAPLSTETYTVEVRNIEDDAGNSTNISFVFSVNNGSGVVSQGHIGSFYGNTIDYTDYNGYSSPPTGSIKNITSPVGTALYLNGEQLGEFTSTIDDVEASYNMWDMLLKVNGDHPVQGDVEFSFTWVDEAGNSSDSIVFNRYIDTYTPQISLTNPSSSTVDQIKTLVFDASEADISEGGNEYGYFVIYIYNSEGSRLDSCFINWNDFVASNSGSVTSCEWALVDSNLEITLVNPIVSAGEYELDVEIQDDASNRSNLPPIQLTVSGQLAEPPLPPVVNEYQTETENKRIYLSGTKTSGTRLFINGIEENISLTATSWGEFLYLESGLNTIEVTTKDANEVLESEPVIVEINFNDTPPPVIDFTITENYRGNSDEVYLRWTNYFNQFHDIEFHDVYLSTSNFLSPDDLTEDKRQSRSSYIYSYDRVLTDIVQGQTYYVVVVATDEAGQLGEYEVKTFTIEKPQQVSNFSSNTLSDTEIELTWDIPELEKQPESYQIKLDDQEVATVSGTAGTYTLTGLTAATLYEASIIAVATSGVESDESDLNVTTAYPHPIGVEVTSSSSSIEATWTPLTNDSGVSAYVLFIEQSDFNSIEGLVRRETVSRTESEAGFSGLANDQTYYVAIATENINGYIKPQIQTFVVTPEEDETPPEIGTIEFAGAALFGQTLGSEGDICVTVTDTSTISRVEFYLDGDLVAIDSTADDGYCYSINPLSLTDGAHQIEVRVFDVFDNTSTETIDFTVALAAPLAPSITSPASGLITNRALISLEGKASAGEEVQVSTGDFVSDWLSVSSNGEFYLDFSLPQDGENTITAKARNRSGEGAVSTALTVTLDRTLPATPIGVTATASEFGQVELRWSVNATSGIAGYNIYRAPQPFELIDQASKVNSNLVSTQDFSDILSDDGDYYYRIAAVNAIGTSSELSSDVVVSVDSTPPVAESITYSTNGAYDQESQTYGVGVLSLELTVNEPLLTTPFLSITPDGRAPISVILTPAVNDSLRYSGVAVLNEEIGSGVAFAVFSARDKTGNRGTEVLEGAQINIDTQGPIVTQVTAQPDTPIQNDSANPVSIEAIFDLDEPVANDSTFAVSYKLSGDNREPTLINDVTKLEEQKWQANFELPANAGLDAPENLTFSFTAEDALGNQGDRFAQEHISQIYQGDLPPLETPFNFRGSPIAGGKVKLEWFLVENALGYQLYRKAPGEAELTEHQRLNQSGYFEDETTVDGEYEYQIASIRSANNMESLSARSDVVTVDTDSVAPPAPENLTLELTPIGVQTRWNPVLQADIKYKLYRDISGPIVTTEGLEPVLEGLTEPFVVDTRATQELPYYAVVAVDEIGNESQPSNTAFLNVDLLPISTVKVRLEAESSPEISWTHTKSSIDQFDIYLGTDESGLKLNETPIQEKRFTDEGYANNERQYAVVAIDANAQQSIARPFFLPKVEMSITPDQVIKRNLMNGVMVDVSNLSSVDMTSTIIKLVTSTATYQSTNFALAADETKKITVVVPGIADLPSTLDFSLELHSKPNKGEQIEIAQPASLDVLDGALGLQLQTEEFLRGGEGQFTFSLTNTGAEEIELLTARNFGNRNSPDITFTIIDDEDNVLALAPFRQALGEGVLNKASGSAVAMIAAGETWQSQEVMIDVPENAPQNIYLTVQVNNLYANIDTPQEVKVKGPNTKQLISLKETPYVGSIDSVLPAQTFGDEPVVIKGKAIDRETQQPLAGVDLRLIIAISGFEREFDVITDENGDYELSYQPQTGESGRYTLSALHPELTSRPKHGEFVVSSLRISPRLWNLNIPYNSNYDININFTAGDGTELNNLRFEMRPEDQPSAIVPEGITLTYPEIPQLLSEKTIRKAITMRASSDAEARGQFIVSVFADEGADEPIGTVDVLYNLSEAKPVISHSPSIVEIGTTLDGVETAQINIENRGVEALRDATVKLKTIDDFPAPEWISLLTDESIGELAIGEETTVNMQVRPDNQAPVGVEQLQLVITSSNAKPYYVPVVVSVSESGEGGALFKITDMYTGTLDGQGRIIQGLQNASVRLQNEQLPDIEYNLRADALGEVLQEDIPAGRYLAWISADNYQEKLIRMRIQPGLVASEQVFLNYNLIRLEWSVNEITIEDRYEIVLTATFETDVPAAVVMLEPTNIQLPEMDVGDVIYGELVMTNYGLIRAFDINFTPQQSDEFFQFEYLTSVVPESLEAKEVVVIPYKVTALKSLEQQDASGGGCGAYNNCAACAAKSRCPTGTEQSNTGSCATRSFGDCSGGSPTDESRTDGGGGGYDGPGGTGGPGPSDLEAIPGLPPCRPDGGDGDDC